MAFIGFFSLARIIREWIPIVTALEKLTIFGIGVKLKWLCKYKIILKYEYVFHYSIIFHHPKPWRWRIIFNRSAKVSNETQDIASLRSPTLFIPSFHPTYATTSAKASMVKESFDWQSILSLSHSRIHALLHSKN